MIRIFNKVLVIVALLMYASTSYGQISFKMDSLRIMTISDYEIDWTKRLIWNEYEDMIMLGPCAYVHGMLTNEYDHTIFVQSCWFRSGPEMEFGGHISEISFTSSFDHEGRKHYSSSIVLMGMDKIEFLDKRCVQINDPVTGNVSLGYLIKSGESVPIFFKMHVFDGCDVSKLRVYDKRGRYGYLKFYKSNIKEGFRLEKISRLTTSTLQFTPQLIVYDEERMEHFYKL